MEGLRRYQSAIADNARWEEFEHRAGDIYICSPPKCGTTWAQTIVANLLWPEGDLPGPVLVISRWIDSHLLPTPEMQGLFDSSRRRFAKTHTPADGIPWFDTGRYVFVGRDGRDAFMSLCNHHEKMRGAVKVGLNERAATIGVAPMPHWSGDVHEFYEKWLAEGVFLHHVASFWERRHQENLLLVHYNDLKADLPGETRRIADHLGITVSDELWPGVVERSTFESMRSRGDEIGQFDLVFEGGADSFLYRATNGRWRGVLTDDELDVYNRAVAATLPREAAHWLEHGRLAARMQ